MSLAFVAAEGREFDGILRHSSNIQKLAWPLKFARSVQVGGRRAVLVANGPGPKLAGEAAREALKRVDNVEAVISTGFCGALDMALKHCDVFVADSVNDFTVNAPEVLDGAYSRGALVSRDRVAWTLEEKRRLREAEAIAVDMEAAGIAEAAASGGVVFYCVRVVTDTAEETLPIDFNAMRDATGRFSRTRILGAALRRPALFGELMKLRRTCNRASLALGDFVANCRF